MRAGVIYVACFDRPKTRHPHHDQQLERRRVSTAVCWRRRFEIHLLRLNGRGLRLQ